MNAAHGVAVVHGVDAVDAEPSAVTIGNFDGVHRGHRRLLERAIAAARGDGLRAVAVTFDPHPAAVLRPGSQPLALATLDERVRLLGEAGADLVAVLPFTPELARSHPDDFVRRILVDGLQARWVVVGTNFRFGHGAAGDVDSLRASGAVHGFAVEAVAIEAIDGEAISSSAIRAALGRGDVAWAARALGRPYALRGEVVRGDGRGRGIGVPTANLAVPDGLVVPAHGVYAGRARLVGAASGDSMSEADDEPADGLQAWCVTNVGLRPTFGAHERPTVEAHLLDVDRDLYGRDVEVTFEHRLRGEQRFSSIDELVAHIHADVGRARQLLAPPDSSGG